MARRHHATGLGLVLDVVPNHMGILGNENPWWNDVLENGQASRYARYFDIDWSAPTRPENRAAYCCLSWAISMATCSKEASLRIAREGGTFHVQYHDHRFPLDPKSYRHILEPALQSLGRSLGAEHEAVLEFQASSPRSKPARPYRNRD